MKNAIVTGAAKRIGKALCQRLADEGYNIALHYNNSADDAKLLADSLPTKTYLIQADLAANPTANIVEQAANHLGQIDLLINNASAFNKCSFMDTNEQLYDAQHNIHVKAPFFLAQQMAKQANNSHIINLLDTNITKNKTTYFAYLLAKKSLANLADMLAVELGSKLRINNILPGATELSDNLDQDYLNNRVGQLPMQRYTSLNEICEAMIFLENNPNLTAQNIYLDGGEQVL